MRSSGWVAAFAVCVAIGLAGCSLLTDGPDIAGAGRPTVASAGTDGPSEKPGAKVSKKAPAPKVRWVCSYDPTLNRNWHDDVLCTKGSKSVRPNLLPNDRFVTEDEIMKAAKKHQDKLNASH